MTGKTGQAAPTDDVGLIARILALYTALAAARVGLTRAAVDAATGRAAVMGEWRDADAITAWAAEVVAATAPSNRAMAAATRATDRRALSALTGKSLTPARQVATEGMRGVPDEVLWGRLADYYRFEISRGATPQRAQSLVVDRAAIIAETNVTLAMRDQAGADLNASKDVIGWRRVIHPELSESGTSCGLCIVASDRWYTRSDLMPIHARCNCLVMPITRKSDPGFRINQDDLNDLYAAAGTNKARDLKETRFAIRQHGELGPVLVNKGNRFRGPAQVARDDEGGKQYGEGDLPATGQAGS